MTRLFLLPASLLAALVALAQQPAQSPPAAPAGPDWSLPYAATITPESLRQDLTVLASDAFEGRETGHQGQRMAADYLSRQFAADGLASPVANSDNPYLQHFNLKRTTLEAATLQLGGQTYRVNQDFYAALEGPYEGALRMAFGGYGIKEKAYADDAVAPGKDLVLLLGEPTDGQGRSLLSADGQPSAYAPSSVAALEARLSYLQQARPRSLILVLPDSGAFAQAAVGFKDLLNPEHLAFAGAPAGPGMRILLVSPRLGAQLLGTTPAGLAAWQRAVGQARRAEPAPFQPASMATVQATFRTETIATENVLGYLEGTDKKEEVLVISAHYDHLGIKNGVVFNGADDDGSGTSSVLALARAFCQAKKEGHGPRRSLLFLANTGEEEGLLGSQYYAEHPVFPLKNTVTDLNIDMVGRVDKAHEGRGDYLYVVGDDKLSSELRPLSEATNQQYGPITLDYKYNDPADPEQLYYRSDHYNFAQHKVPVIFYTSGLHADYHAASDDVDKIDFPALARRDQLVFHTAWVLANRARRVAVDSNKR